MRRDRSKPPLRAFSVLEDSENTGGIYFVHHAIVARRLGASEFNGGEFEGMMVRRVPWADKYAAHQHVPIREAVKYGWWFECYGCGMTINEDNLADARMSVDSPIGFLNSAHWCSKKCCLRSIHMKRRKDGIADEIRQTVIDRILSKHPDAKPVDKSDKFASNCQIGHNDRVFFVESCTVSFNWPGGKFGAFSVRYKNSERIPNLNWRDKHMTGPQPLTVSVANGGRDEFMEWWNGTRAD